MSLFLCLATFGIAAEPVSTLACNGDPAFSDLHVNTSVVSLYAKFEITFQATGHWTNPFDPDQIAIDCEVVPPHGDSYTMPAFYYQEYRREEVNGLEKLTPLGAPCWKVRLTPTQVGLYHYRLKISNHGRFFEGAIGSFEGVADNSHGFIRVSSINRRYFQYDDGTPFFGVGEDMLMFNGRATYATDKWLTSLARAGGNIVRTWWCSAGIDLEDYASANPRRSLGIYDLESAWRCDHLVNLAGRLGVGIMATLEAQQYLRKGVWWERFTYNAANGGPLASPGDFFTNQAAEAAFRKRLRYIVARWSYSPAVFSWQFWNEVDSCNDYQPAAVGAWHRSMSQYLRAIDPYRHIIHSNFGNLDGRAEVDDLPETEVVSTNVYTQGDLAQTAYWGARFMTARRDKPYLLTEFGLGHQGGWAENDPEGIALHNGLWGAAFGGAAGGAMPWCWDIWVDRQNLYHHFAVFAQVMRDIPFCRFQWRPVDVDAFNFSDSSRPPYYADTYFEGFSTNFQFNTCPDPLPDVFTVTPDGNVDHPECFAGALYPLDKPGAPAAKPGPRYLQRNAETLLINMPVDGQFIVHVPELASNQHPIMSVTVDGREIIHEALTREGMKKGWEYFRQFPIPLAMGPHRMTVANLQTCAPGDEWTDRLRVAYELTHYVRRDGPDLKCVGLQSDDCILLWLREPEFSWIYARLGRKLAPQPAGILHLRDIPDGRYTVVWTDTWTGEVMRHDIATAQGGRMVLPTPPITRSAVAKLVPLSSTGS